MKFRFLEDVAIADVAFEAFGKTEKELFENCALALFEIIADTKKTQQKKRLEVKLENESLEGLLYDWLSELVFLTDAKRLVFGQFRVKIKKQKKYLLNAEIFGEPKNSAQKRKILRTDVKAITKHMFYIKKEKGRFIARVVPDI